MQLKHINTGEIFSLEDAVAHTMCGANRNQYPSTGDNLIAKTVASLFFTGALNETVVLEMLPSFRKVD